MCDRSLKNCRGPRRLAGVAAAFWVGALLWAVLCPAPSWAATPPNIPITNTARATYEIGGTPATVSGSTTVITAAGTPALIEFRRHTTTAAVAELPVTPTQCNSATLPAPITSSSVSLAIGSLQKLIKADAYAANDAAFIRVTDFDRNTNPLLAETIVVAVTIANSIELETLTLTETGPSTGIFLGYAQTRRSPAQQNDCTFNVDRPNTQLIASYTDTSESNIVIVASALIDPFGVVFNSATGAPIDGATVTLINVATGLPATVFGNDGVSAYPSTVVSGGTVTDAGGEVYVFAPGNYRFPFVAAGVYRLQVTPPAGVSFPSTVANAVLQTRPGAPYTLLGDVGGGASRGGNFNAVEGPPLRIDVPLDPAGGGLQITKTAGKATVSIGDYVPYSLSIRNPNLAAVAGVQVADRLPLGFRYQAGTARLNGAPLADPAISADGRTLTFSLGAIAAGATVTVKYVAAVVAGARVGPADNTAQAVLPAVSNVARATVLVREDLHRSRAILMGRVIVGSCDDAVDNDLVGLANARIVLEDGTYILTDKEGRWHADNIRPGTHVVQLDLDSLPKGYDVVQCQDNSRFAGRTYSQFVNVRGGSLWRADFYVKKIADDQPGRPDDARPPSPPASETPSPPASNASDNIDTTHLVEKLPYDERWLAAAAPGTEWLHPQESFQPALPVVKIAVKHDPRHRLELTLDGAPINPMRYEGIIKNEAGTLGVSLWRAVEIKEGANVLALTLFDAQGNVVMEERRTLHYGGAAVTAQLDASRSVLVADGKTGPVVAIRLLDKDGKPVRRGVAGDFTLNAPYQAQSTVEARQREPLAGVLDGANRFIVRDDGVALIKLQPTTQSGEVVLGFALNRAGLNGAVQTDRRDVRAWLAPGEREWILVGFAEGTIGHKQLSGHMATLNAAQADDTLFDDNRVAFYAKGTIKGEYLLTAAYDTAKETGRGGARNLMQAVDPNQFYTLYADATAPQFDAASASKLYLKIEKQQFYAMFGDYDTGLSVTELGRYSRTLNGVKTAYKGDVLSYNAFATLTAQSYKKDEIQGDGTSGLYKLSSREIVINSDKVRVEVRDRFQSKIVKSVRTYSRYLDYDIDTAAGTLFFREPIPARDPEFNPVFIVVEYEADDSADRKISYGGRAAVQATEHVELGVTHIREGTIGRSGTLTAGDVTLKLTETTKLRAELANSDRDIAGVSANRTAWLAEAKHESERLAVTAYVRESEVGFGLGQQSMAETGMRKFGADALVKLSDQLRVQGAATRWTNLATGAQLDTREAQARWQTDGLSLNAGLRHAKEKDAQNVEREHTQALAGVAYSMLERRLTLSAGAERDLGGASRNGSADFPNRVTFGADYKLTETVAVFAKHELARGRVSADTTNLGLRTQPWQGGEAYTSLGSQRRHSDTRDSERLFAGIGLTQRWQITEHWQANVGMDRSQTLRAVATNPLGTQLPLASGAPIAAAPGITTGDYTVVHAGAGYNDKLWSGNGRLEWRAGESEDKINLLLGAQRTLDAGRAIAAGLSTTHTNSTGSDSTKLALRLSYAHRPIESRWTWLDRLDYVQESLRSAITDSRARKLVNNFNANYMPNRRTQVAMQYGSKYVLDSIEGRDFSGYTHLIGFEIRRDLGSRWDIGAAANMLHAWHAETRDYQLGASIGYRVMDNTWVSLGYNVLGFKDGNFSGADYRADGLYVTFRVKFDQDVLGLK